MPETLLQGHHGIGRRAKATHTVEFVNMLTSLVLPEQPARVQVVVASSMRSPIEYKAACV